MTTLLVEIPVFEWNVFTKIAEIHNPNGLGQTRYTMVDFRDFIQSGVRIRQKSHEQLESCYLLLAEPVLWVDEQQSQENASRKSTS